MDNKDFIGKLSACTGFAEEETVRMVSSLIDCMAQGLQEGKDIQVQGFGLLGVQKEMEYISVNPMTKQRFLIPPCLRLFFIPEGHIPADHTSQRNNLTLQHLIDWLTQDQGFSGAEAFVSSFFKLIKGGMQSDKYVKVKGLGTFKVMAFNGNAETYLSSHRSSLSYGGVSFTADASLRDLVNKPFAHFEIVPLKDNVTFADLPEVSMEEVSPETDEPEDAEVPVEEGKYPAEPEEESAEPNQSVSEEIPLPVAPRESESLQEEVSLPPVEEEVKEASTRRIPWCMLACTLLVGVLIGGGVIWRTVPSRRYISEVIARCWKQQGDSVAAETSIESLDFLAEPTPQEEPDTIAEAPKPQNVEVVPEKKAVPLSVPVRVLSDEVAYIIRGTQCNHTLREGESLTRIARRYYGNKKLWPYLVRHNQRIIKNPDNIPVGTVIQIPVLAPKTSE